MQDGVSPSTRQVWLLTDDRPGNRTQVLGAARALGWPAVEKRLSFNELQRLSTIRLGATLDTLDDASRRMIAPPYPDLIIAAGRRMASVAAWIKRETAGKARIVLIGRKTPDGVADLTVRAEYLTQVPHPDLFLTALPLTQIDLARLDAARRSEPDPFDGLKRPRVAFLVGGPTGQHSLTAAFAGRMARDVSEAAAALGGGLAIVTSRRTPADGLAAIRAATPDARLFPWSPDAAYNPYVAFLAHADMLVVTGESESMLAEAASTGLPLTIYVLEPRTPAPTQRLKGWIASRATGGGPLAALCRRLMSEGWVTPRRDLEALHRLMESRGWGRRFDGGLNPTPSAPVSDYADLRDRMIAIVTKDSLA